MRGMDIKIKYRVDLTNEEREYLLGLIGKGRHGSRTLTRARILLKADEDMTDEAVAAALNVGYATVGRVRQRFVEAGLERALKDGPHLGAKPKLDERQCAHLIAVACSEHPRDMSTGRCVCWQARWSNWHLPNRTATKRYGRRSKKPSQTLAETHVVHPGSQR